MHGWGRALASLASSGTGTRVQVLEVSLPDAGRGITGWWELHGTKQPGQWAVRQYETLMRTAAPTSSTHRTLVAVALDLRAARSHIRQAGRGLRGAVAFLRQEMVSFEASLRAADLQLGCWLSEAELAATLRGAYEPGYDAEQDIPCALEQAGPMAIDEHWGHLRHDTAYSAVLWINEWPRVEAPPFLPGAGYLEADAVVSMSTSILDDLVAEFDETIHLARLDHSEIVYIAKRDSVQPLRLFSSVGRRLPAHATALGKVLLAQRTDDEVDTLLDFPLRRMTPNTIVEPEPLHLALQEIRGRGYAIDSGESTVGLTCTAVVINTGPIPQYALSCSAPDVRITPERHKAILEGLFRAGRKIEARLAPSPMPKPDVS